MGMLTVVCEHGDIKQHPEVIQLFPVQAFDPRQGQTLSFL